MDWNELAKTILSQLGALLAFFVFPAVQYALLRVASHRDGEPELWYLPGYGLRLVISNIPRRKTLSDIRYRALMRRTIPPGNGVTVKTFQDTGLVEREDFFLFPGCDQVLICFQLRSEQGALKFVHTDKLGEAIQEMDITDGHTLVADYTANIENYFNFDIRLSRRVEITGQLMRTIAGELAGTAEEKRFDVSRVRKVG